ncbi:MAG: DUF1566 domain-containing protein [Candidatus Dadabacteria bacterium]|nr:DUF1566 domain-containing protein [Candidatus Dadabacteria bacterium]NIQ16766.1 DUF1566 domain-containing protein [Candidatus Dadabacteria bacterium]
MGFDDNSAASIITFRTIFSQAKVQECGVCGLSDGSTNGDWYLPNRNQLASLLDLQNSNPALPTNHPFLPFQSSLYWSSTTVADSPADAWYVDFADGVVAFSAKSGFVGHVLAVRGGS